MAALTIVELYIKCQQKKVKPKEINDRHLCIKDAIQINKDAAKFKSDKVKKI